MNRFWPTVIQAFVSKIHNARNKRMMINVLSSLFIKGGGLIVALFTIPAYLTYFDNKTVLGFWFAAVSILSVILTFDFGISNGLRNHLVIAFAEKNELNAKAYISSAYVITTVTTIIMSLVGLCLIRILDWNQIFNISNDVINNVVLTETATMVFFSIMLQFLFRNTSAIYFALQKAYVPSLTTLASNVFLLIYVLVANKEVSTHSKLSNLSVANLVTSSLPLVIATFLLFAGKLKNCRPSFTFFNRRYAKQVFVLGGSFFLIQVMYMIIVNTNEFLIASIVSSQDVVEYKIYNSLFSALSSLFLLALTPIWSEVTEAYAKSDMKWVGNIYVKLQKIALGVVVLEVVLLIFMQQIVNIWLGENTIRVNFYSGGVFVFFNILFIWNAVLSSIVNGIGKLRLALIYFTLGALVNIPLAYLINLLLNSWISVIWANIISLLPYCVAQTFWLKKYLNKQIYAQR